MDLCLIPPFLHLRQFPQKRHLVLSHLLQYKVYRDFYAERRIAGDYIILDNSAHENGLGEGPGKLLLQALDLQPHELVVPDALENAQRTVELARSAVVSWYGSDYRLQSVNPRLMYVPQGQNVYDWIWCLRSLLDLHEYAASLGGQRGCTIGISKDYAHWEHGLRGLVTTILQHQRSFGIQIHLLGCGHDYHSLARLTSTWIRSVDTAKPFVWAMNGMRMSTTPEPLPSAPLPARPREYFFRELRGDTFALAKNNAEVLRALVEG